MTRRSPPSLSLVLCGASLSFLVALAWPLFRGELWNADDLGWFHWPLRAFYGECLRHGDAFDWMPSLFSGFYLTGEGQVGTYHPWHWLLYRHFPWQHAFAAEMLINYPLLFVGTYAWLRPLVRTREAALFAAFVFTFGSFNVLRFVHVNALSVICHVPWLLACQRRFGAAGFEPATTLAIPLLVGSQVLLGYPQYVWFTALAELVWGLSLWGGNWRRWIGFAALQAAGLALGAVQLLATYDWLGESQRVAEASSYFRTYSVSAKYWLLFASPYFGRASHEFPLYLGVVPTACVVVASCERRFRESRLWKWCMGAALAAFVMSLGVYGGVFLLQRWLPVVGSFRVPSRYLFLAHLALAPLVARGFELARRLSSRSAQRAGRIWIDAVVAFVGCGIYGVVRAQGAGRWAAFVPILVSLIVMLALRRRRLDDRQATLLAAVNALDLLVFGVIVGAFLASAPTTDGPAFPPPPPDRSGRVVLQPQTLQTIETGYNSNDLARLGVRQADGYAGLPPRSRLFGPGAGVSALRVAGVRWVLQDVVPEGFEGLGAEQDGWRLVPDPLPRVRTVGEWAVSSDPRTDVERIDPSRIALLESPLAAPLDAAADGELEVRVDRPGRLELDADLAGARLVIFAERHHRGWRAAVDGRPVENLRVYGDFQGCVVPAGRHAVEFRFAPDSLRIGKIVSLASLVALLAATLALATWRRRGPRGDSAVRVISAAGE